MSSDKNKELFLQQVQQILDGIKQDKEQLSQRCVEERKEKDRLTTIHLDLIDKQRKYYKTVKDFQEVREKWEMKLLYFILPLCVSLSFISFFFCLGVSQK